MLSKRIVFFIVVLCALGGFGLAVAEEGVDSIFDPIKKISLGENSWLSVGGEVRFRSEVWSDFAFGEANDDEFNLIRVFLHTDWHFGEHWRVFLQGKYTDAFTRDLPGGERDALDADHGDIWNAFVEGNYTFDRVGLTFRLGRQELLYGKERLVSPLDWSNNRRIFDGVVVSLAGLDKRWKLDGFVTAPVVTDTNSFNDVNDDVYFTGLYYNQKLGAENKYDLDAYLLSLISESDAPIDEDRHTLGARISGPIGSSKHFSFEVESALQFGEQDGADIFAWMLTTEATYRRADVGWKPWLTVGIDYASGDDDPTDGDMGTFNQLFPLGHAYLGFIDAVGRQNIIDLRGTVGVWPIDKKLMFRGDVHYFLLANEDDGLYHAGGGSMRKPYTMGAAGGGVTSITNDRNVGTELDLTAKYIFNRYANVQFGYSHFFAGDFIDDTGSDEDIDFFYSQLGFKF